MKTTTKSDRLFMNLTFKIIEKENRKNSIKFEQQKYQQFLNYNQLLLHNFFLAEKKKREKEEEVYYMNVKWNNYF